MKLKPLPINGNIPVSVPAPVTLHLYFNPNPSNSWNDPDTFSSGKEIARFNRAANLFFSVGTTSFDIFSLDLVFSQDFTINGQEVNRGKIVPHGVTSNNIEESPEFLAAVDEGIRSSRNEPKSSLEDVMKRLEKRFGWKLN